MAIQRSELSWTVGFCSNPTQAVEKRVPAQVPGAVQLDWARAHDWPDHNFGDNPKQYAWMEDVYWSYITMLHLPERSSDQRLFFICGGVDYQFEIRLNGRTIHAQEGMFTPVEIDLTDIAIEGDALEVLVSPVPKSNPKPDKKQANQCCKPPVSYGWDWHPRLIPLGIWKETYLEVRPRVHLRDFEMRYDLSEDFQHADLTVDVELSDSSDGQVRWQLFDRAGAVVCAASAAANEKHLALHATLNNPQLWWPNEQGEPILYVSRIDLLDAAGEIQQTQTKRVGFRRARLVIYQGGWGEPNDFPATRNSPPITLEINGRRIFAKGSNWVNPDIFPGEMSAETYRPLLKMAKDAHFNLLRVWGGGIVNKESFFEQCDELGLMVWQEFPLAGNNYEGTPKYLTTLDSESRSIIRALRQHACLAIWCGGNELFNSWTRMTDQSLALRLLNRNCFDLDPNTPFLMTSPMMGMGHGGYLFRYKNGRELFEVMLKSNRTAYTEFGVPSPADADIIRKYIPQDQLWPPRPGTAWETHHAFNAWGQGTTWLQHDVIADYFGPTDDLETLVERGQLMQSEGYKCIFEEARRQKPRCAMALNWCYNEPWPCVANNSIIQWPAKPKPAYHTVAASCRPTLASARIPKFVWKSGETFNPELWLLHDSADDLPAASIEAFLRINGEEVLLIKWDHPAVSANTNLRGPTVEYIIPDRTSQGIDLILRSPQHPERNSQYTLLCRATT